ncbi:hypothetical protein BDR04DRAFT_1123337 [Suillus decipiens]|nr:hypothetical protein BDR04DRAFT_1123337 [Suillus decipiens]
MDKECDRELDPKDYPDVKSWTKRQWQGHSPKNNYSQRYNYHVKKRGTKRIKSDEIPSPPSPSSENDDQIETFNAESLEIKNTLLATTKPSTISLSESSTAAAPPSMPLSKDKLANTTSLAVKMELVATGNTTKATETKAAGDSTKKRQPSMKPISKYHCTEYKTKATTQCKPALVPTLPNKSGTKAQP